MSLNLSHRLLELDKVSLLEDTFISKGSKASVGPCICSLLELTEELPTFPLGLFSLTAIADTSHSPPFAGSMIGLPTPWFNKGVGIFCSTLNFCKGLVMFCKLKHIFFVRLNLGVAFFPSPDVLRLRFKPSPTPGAELFGVKSVSET
uniref:Uncharacterized protein n=1 Tax=Cacopsylla melanoneura TaxID=428564 RepID=A0A8D8V0S0_9HEMI